MRETNKDIIRITIMIWVFAAVTALTDTEPLAMATLVTFFNIMYIAFVELHTKGAKK